MTNELEKSLNDFLNKKTKETIFVFTTLFMFYNSFMAYGIKQKSDREFGKGQSQGIELMKKIYETHGGNEALRYSINQ